jgi:hypothetical protein
MKKTLLAMLACVMMGCGGPTVETVPATPEPADTAAMPGPLAGNPGVYAGDGWKLDLTNWSEADWRQVNMHPHRPGMRALVLRAEVSQTLLTVVQFDSTETLTNFASEKRAQMLNEGFSITWDKAVIRNGVSSFEVEATTGPATMWVAFFTTGKHAFVVSCGGETEVKSKHGLICDAAVYRFQITE